MFGKEIASRKLFSKLDFFFIAAQTMSILEGEVAGRGCDKTINDRQCYF